MKKDWFLVDSVEWYFCREINGSKSRFWFIIIVIVICVF